MINASLVLTLAAALVASPDGVREPLSFEAALERARAQNRDLCALRERSKASATRAQAVSKQKVPRLGLEIGAQRTDNAAAVFANKLNAGQFEASDFDLSKLNSPSALSHLGSALYLEVPIDLFGRMNLAAEVQAASQRAFAENVREAEAELSLRVTEAYLGALLAHRAVLATEKAVAAARSREEVTEARFAEGVVLSSDILRVRARRRTREADLASQHAELEVAEAMLARLVGAADGVRFDLTDSPKPALGSEPVETWKARSAAGRPGLIAARDERDAAALSVDLERQSSRPELAAQARLMDDRTTQGGAQSWAIGAVLRWNFLDATRGKRLAAAQADERAAAEDERSTRDRVRFEVEAAFSRLAAARDRLAAAEGGAQEGREALRVIQERRGQGLATLTDELETEAAAFAAELEEINAARTAALAEAALRRASGVNSGSPR